MNAKLAHAYDGSRNAKKVWSCRWDVYVNVSQRVETVTGSESGERGLSHQAVMFGVLANLCAGSATRRGPSKFDEMR
jgi:hypothetical protein